MTDKIKEPIGILADVFDVLKGEDDTYILDSYSSEATELIPIICEISEEDSGTAKQYIDKQLMIHVTAYAISEPEIYTNEEDFAQGTEDSELSIASQSFLASPNVIIIDEKEVPVPKAMITGIVKNVTGPHTFQGEDSLIDYCETQIEIFGIEFTAIFKNVDVTDIKPGNIITCIYYLYGDLYKDKDN